MIRAILAGVVELPKVYTSHWGSALLPHIDAQMVAISRGKPRWKLSFWYRVLPALAPSREIFGLEEPDEFNRRYIDQLEEHGVERILADLAQISSEHGGRPLVLLCWEKPGDYCHRRLLADWLEERTGVVVPELIPGVLPGAAPPNQAGLF